MPRFQTLIEALQERWGVGASALLERAWRSEELTDCATFGEWLATLPEVRSRSEKQAEGKDVEPPVDLVRSMIDLARHFETRGKANSALETYRKAQTLVPASSGLAEELQLIIENLSVNQEEATSEPQPSEGTNLKALFDKGLAAYRKGEWEKAKELLTEVTRRDPDYERDGLLANELLARAEQEGNSRPHAK